MMRDKWINAAIALVLSVAIALAGMGCITSGFHLEPGDWTHIIAMTVFLAMVSVLCLSFKLGELVLTALALLSAYLAVRHGDLLLSLEKLLNHISCYYDSGYHTGVIRWSWENLSQVAPDSALLALVAISIMATCWTLQRRQWFGCALVPGLLPLVLCCVLLDTVPDGACLWVLLTALLLLTVTQLLRRVSLPDANRLTALLLVPVLLFSTLVFRFTSQDDYGDRALKLQQDLLNAMIYLNNLGALPQSTGTIPAVTLPADTSPIVSPPILTSVVDLSSAGALRYSGQPVMRVITTEWEGVLYLRGQAYDEYTGLSWSTTPESWGDQGWPNGTMLHNGYVTVKTDTSQPIQYFPYYVNIQGWESRIQNGYFPNPNGLKAYTFVIYTPLALPDDEVPQVWDVGKYTALPEKTLADAQKFLTAAGVHSGMTAKAIADAVADYVRQSATYDRSTAAMPQGEEDFAIWFLENGETGYCVHFASAATVLMRAAGIPARYVTGYMTSVNPGAECAVLDRQAHAWVEYYHPNLGWTRLEATPAEPGEPVIIPPPTTPTESTAPTESSAPTESTAPSQDTEPTESASPTESTAPSRDTEPTLPVTTEPGQTLPAPTEPGQKGSWTEQLNLKWIRGILWILALWLLIAGQYRLRILLRKHQTQKGSPNRQAICRWRHVRRIARISGLTAGELLPLAEKAAFSQHELTAEELAQFDDWFRRANLALLEKPWMTQFFLRLLFAVE